MDNKFKEGYDFFIKNTSIFTSTKDIIDDRVEIIKNTEIRIKELEDNINSFKGYNTDVAQLKGDMAEFWHAGTYNIDAAKNNSSNVVNVDRSHKLGSVDLTSSDGQKYGLKYYNKAELSAKAQSTSYFERYSEYKSQGHNESFEEYLSKNGINSDSVLRDDPIYSGQQRIIPSDQYQEAVKYLEEKIAKESLNRPEQVNKYKETLELLRTRIEDSDGNKSIELSKSDSERLAKIAKSRQF